MGLNANINEIEKPRENPGEGRDILGPAADSGQQVNQQTSKDRTFELYSINFFPADFPLSHRSVLLAQIINYEKHLKTTASPSQETDSRQPKRLYTLSYLLKNDKKQTENNEGDQFAAGHQKQMKRPRKPSNHSPTKRRRSATVTHDVRDRKMENHPTPPDGFLPKAVAPEVMHRAGAGAPPNQLGSPTDDFAQGGLIPKPGSNSLGGTKSCSAADPKVPAMSSPGAVPNIPQVSPAMAKKINDDIKYQLMKEVRKFGRKYERIFTLLEEVRGPLAVKKQFVEFTIKEAARFKRGVLIQQLEKVLEKIESCRCLKKVNHQKSK